MRLLPALMLSPALAFAQAGLTVGGADSAAPVARDAGDDLFGAEAPVKAGTAAAPKSAGAEWERCSYQAASDLKQCPWTGGHMELPFTEGKSYAVRFQVTAEAVRRKSPIDGIGGWGWAFTTRTPKPGVGGMSVHNFETGERWVDKSGKAVKFKAWMAKGPGEPASSACVTEGARTGNLAAKVSGPCALSPGVWWLNITSVECPTGAPYGCPIFADIHGPMADGPGELASVPGGPTNPGNPTNPVNPGNPTTPGNPGTPANPGTGACVAKDAVPPMPEYSNPLNLRFNLQPGQAGSQAFDYPSDWVRETFSVSAVGATNLETPPGTHSLFAISACRGDFDVPAGCRQHSSPNAHFRVGKGTGCELKPGTYYINVKHVLLDSPSTPSCRGTLGYCTSWVKLN